MAETTYKETALKTRPAYSKRPAFNKRPAESRLNCAGTGGSAGPGIYARMGLAAGLALGLALLLALVLGCGYSASPTLSSSIKRIYIPTFENETIRYGIEQDLTRVVAEAFTADNRLTVVSERDADVMLRGVIIQYEKGAFTFDRASTVEEFRVSISISVALEDLKEGKVIWEDNTMNAWEAYEETGDATTSEDEATAKVYVTLANDIVARTLEGW